MTKSSQAFALDHGTLHLEFDLNLRTLAAGVAFAAIFAVELAVMFLAAPGYDVANQLLFTT